MNNFLDTSIDAFLETAGFIEVPIIDLVDEHASPRSPSPTPDTSGSTLTSSSSSCLNESILNASASTSQPSTAREEAVNANTEDPPESEIDDMNEDECEQIANDMAEGNLSDEELTEVNTRFSSLRQEFFDERSSAEVRIKSRISDTLKNVVRDLEERWSNLREEENEEWMSVHKIQQNTIPIMKQRKAVHQMIEKLQRRDWELDMSSSNLEDKLYHMVRDFNHTLARHQTRNNVSASKKRLRARAPSTSAALSHDIDSWILQRADEIDKTNLVNKLQQKSISVLRKRRSIARMLSTLRRREESLSEELNTLNADISMRIRKLESGLSKREPRFDIISTRQCVVCTEEKSELEFLKNLTCIHSFCRDCVISNFRAHDTTRCMLCRETPVNGFIGTSIVDGEIRLTAINLE